MRTKYEITQEIIRKCHGQKLDEVVYSFNGKIKWQIECPDCKKYCGMIGYTKDGNNFIFNCPNSCCSAGSKSLERFLEDHDQGLYKEWMRDIRKKWVPIQNRGSGQQKQRRTFKEKQENRSIAQEIMIRASLGEISPQ